MLLSLLLFTCAAQTKNTVVPEKPSPPSMELQSIQPVKSGWEKEMDETMKAAKTEGSLVIYTFNGPEVRQALSESFGKKFGIKTEFVAGGSQELIQRMNREWRAGIDYVDLFLSGSSDMVVTLKPTGALTSLKPLLLLPEVLDPKAWYIGELPFVDREKQFIFVALGNPGTSIVINTSLVKPEEMKSYTDLLAPKWKGKIIMGDPTVPGSGGRWFAAMSHIMNQDFLRKLAGQNPALTRNRRLMAEWLAQAKYPIGIAAGFQDVSPFIQAGAPLRNVTPVEGTYISGAAGTIVVVRKSPHPQTAKLFVNWYLSREGQTVFSKAHVSHSGRVDVPFDFLPEGKSRIPGVKYFPTENEDFLLSEPQSQKFAQEILGHLLVR